MRVLQNEWVLCTALCALVVAATGCLSAFDWSCRADATCPPESAAVSTTTSSGDGGATGTGTGGSGNTGGESTTSSGGAGGGSPCSDGPIDPLGAPIDPACGLWVSASIGDDANPGTQQEPVKTIAQAIELAKGGLKHIYACGETYVEAVELPAGISLFGGFIKCKSTSPWVYNGSQDPAIIAPGKPGMVALTLVASEGASSTDATSYVGDLRAESADAAEPGGSSIAVLAQQGARATIRRSTFAAGNAADGADGEPGDHAGVPAKKGLPGNDGADACTMEAGLGGSAVELQCDDGAISKGGEGGDGNEGSANNGHQGDPQPMPNPLGYGGAGNGEDAVQGMACTPGSGGAQGLDGMDGVWPPGVGRLTPKGYLGEPGGDGQAATPGQGGGGGGASIGKASCGGAFHGGPGGGSGGTGGCGGKGGKGGQAGGSSIGLACLSKDIRTEGVQFVTGKGGNGGNGGARQAGGQGGLPGLGGAGLGGVDPIKKGCAGGAGGYGGNGGNGAGGHGGHSLAIAFIPGKPAVAFDPSYQQGPAGIAGHSGDPAAPIPQGLSGSAAQALMLEP